MFDLEYWAEVIKTFFKKQSFSSGEANRNKVRCKREVLQPLPSNCYLMRIQIPTINSVFDGFVQI